MNGVPLVVNGYINILLRSNGTSVECCSTCDVELKARVFYLSVVKQYDLLFELQC